MPPRATAVNQRIEDWPLRAMMSAASSGPSDDPRLPPVWNTDCASPCRSPAAMCATREASGWKIAEPMPTMTEDSKDHRVAARLGEEGEAHQGDAHAESQGIGLVVPVRVAPDQGLEDRRRELKAERDQAHLRVAQAERLLEDGIDRRQSGCSVSLIMCEALSASRIPKKVFRRFRPVPRRFSAPGLTTRIPAICNLGA